MKQKVKGTKGEKSREQLIECAARLFLEKGYNATGINEILNNAGLTKGSFYFYFSSKKDLAIAVSEYYSQLKLGEVLEAANDRTWGDFIEKFVGDMIKKSKGKQVFGCPVAVLGMEVAFIEPDISTRNYVTFKSLVSVFEDVLKRSGMPEEKAAINAERALAIFEGYLLFYRLSKDTNELEKLLRDLKEIL